MIQRVSGGTSRFDMFTFDSSCFFFLLFLVGFSVWIGATTTTTILFATPKCYSVVFSLTDRRWRSRRSGRRWIMWYMPSGRKQWHGSSSQKKKIWIKVRIYDRTNSFLHRKVRWSTVSPGRCSVVGLLWGFDVGKVRAKGNFWNNLSVVCWLCTVRFGCTTDLSTAPDTGLLHPYAYFLEYLYSTYVQS
jgi:hypothetical protein